jgi:hypothetical protein
VCASHTNREPETSVVNSHLPFAPSATGIVLALAGLCGISGVILFFRGLSLLQRSSKAKPATPKLESSAMKPAATVAARTMQIQGTNVRTEVIRLTSDEAPAVSMSQQAKIAAALLKAGIPSPASWNTEPGASVDTATSGAKNPRALQTAKLTVTGNRNPQPSDARKDDSRKPDSSKPGTPSRSKRNSGAWMLWTGIALVVLCVYLVAAHFGWL